MHCASALAFHWTGGMAMRIWSNGGQWAILARTSNMVPLQYRNRRSRWISMNIDVQKVAMLARIRLTDEEAAKLGPQLEQIVGYIDQLSEIDTEGVPPTAHPHDVAMPLRADIVSNANRREALQQPAPATESGLYIVPKVIE